MKVRADAIQMVGKKYGHLTVLACAGCRDFGVMPSTGWRTSALLYRVRCDCGRELVVEGRRIRGNRYCAGINACPVCTAAAAHDRASVQLPSGRTIREVAQRTGIKLDTIYHRWIRGWLERDLVRKPIKSGTHKRSAR